MASQDRRPAHGLRRKLLNEGHEFSFYQVMRLLKALGDEDLHRRSPTHVRVRPELSLAFPAADIAKIEQNERDSGPAYTVTTTFLGLYGSSSPLPTFYTEDLLMEASEDESVTRDFLDILNQPLYDLLFKCWTKYRLFIEVVEEQSDNQIERLFCLLGLGCPELIRDLPEAYRLIRYLGIFTQHPRSAVGLKTILRDIIKGMPIELDPCLPRMAQIPEEQRCYLGISGSTLGVDTFIGKEILDRTGRFRLKIGPLTKEQFKELLPGGETHRMMVMVTDFYLATSLDYDMEVSLYVSEVRSTCLGASDWSRLGYDTWIFSGQLDINPTVFFNPQKQKQGEKSWSA